jgi:translocation and assembly module TamB
LPQDEVLSRILFGKGMTKISPFQAIQLASTLRRFSGNGGGFEPLGMFRKATGLDDLQVERDEKGATTVGAGKYITDKVYLEAEAGSGESSGAAKVKIDLTPHVKAESKIGRDNKTGGGLMWQWDY